MASTQNDQLLFACYTELYLQISITQDNLNTVVNNLTAVVMATNETADQNRDNIQVIRTTLAQTATLLQNASVPLRVVEQVSPCVSINELSILDNLPSYI